MDLKYLVIKLMVSDRIKVEDHKNVFQMRKLMIHQQLFMMD